MSIILSLVSCTLSSGYHRGCSIVQCLITSRLLSWNCRRSDLAQQIVPIRMQRQALHAWSAAAKGLQRLARLSARVKALRMSHLLSAWHKTAAGAQQQRYIVQRHRQRTLTGRALAALRRAGQQSATSAAVLDRRMNRGRMVSYLKVRIIAGVSQPMAWHTGLQVQPVCIRSTCLTSSTGVCVAAWLQAPYVFQARACALFRF